VLIWSTAAAPRRCRKIFDELPSVLIRRSFEQLGSPAGFRRLLALAFAEILSSPGIYRSGGSLVKKSGE